MKEQVVEWWSKQELPLRFAIIWLLVLMGVLLVLFPVITIFGLALIGTIVAIFVIIFHFDN